MRAVLSTAGLIVALAAGTADATTLADVRAAKDTRHALALAKRVPEVKAALRRGVKLRIATMEKTAQSIAKGKMESAQTGGWAMGGVDGELRLVSGVLRPRVEFAVTPTWIYASMGYVGSSSRHVQLPVGAEAANPGLNPGGDLLEQDGWTSQQSQTRVMRVATWRDNYNARAAKKSFKVSPASIADNLEVALREAK